MARPRDILTPEQDQKLALATASYRNYKRLRDTAIEEAKRQIRGARRQAAREAQAALGSGVSLNRAAIEITNTYDKTVINRLLKEVHHDEG